jgi:quinol monooxygenase YgiN
MFGTIAILKPKQGRESDVLAHFDKWWKERSGKVKGALGGDLRRNASNPAELIATVSFASVEEYRANAEDPAQDAWFRQLAEMLDGEPRWIDGEILLRHTG